MEPLEYVRAQFQRYYETRGVIPPTSMEQREFAMTQFGRSGMWRHIGFRTEEEMRAAFARHAPAAVYYSTAYYTRPSAGTMPEKDWLGADLVFDLDADHIKGAEGLQYHEMLQRVKEEFIKLLEDFILSDLGFAPEHVKVAFSGARGYHAHVTDPKVRGLRSHERREIVDYIGAVGLDPDWLFPPEAAYARGAGRWKRTFYRRLFRSEGTGGWAGIVRRCLPDILRELEGMDKKDALKVLCDVPGVGEVGARRLYDDLFKGAVGTRGMDKIINEWRVEAFSEDRHRHAFIGLVKQRVEVSLTGEADEPVTSDVKRLIRLPGTLHAKTGFVAVPLQLDAIKEFDPFRDALQPTLSSAPIRLIGVKDAVVRFGSTDLKISEGDEIEVPEPIALFLVCQRLSAPV
ncbi:MAG: DNA primase small subunit PriS [Candidatus Thermoplasmatota archaeon]